MPFLLGLHKLCQALLVVYIYSSCLAGNGAATAIFVVKPGEGKEYFTTPVGRNATLECSAISTSFLIWRIDGYDPRLYDSERSGLTLQQSEPIRASTGELSSTLTVNGTVQGNGIEICCQITGPQQCCTNLIIYDHPSSPENITIQSISAGSINITWDTESVTGVDQYYIVDFTSNMSRIISTKPFLSLNQSIDDIQCGTSLLITAANGAGESSLSTLVLPSLPDIGSVSASLEHQVWKVNGGVLVRVSFKPAETCIHYPVQSYLLILKSLSGKIINVTLGCNETETFLNGLEDNKMYIYSITAINTVGNATTYSKKALFTSDVQNVTAIEVDEYTVKTHCYYVNGSDAQGCLVVFINNFGQVHNQTVRLENSSTAWEEFNLNHPISCYHRVLAFDIEAGGNVSDIAIVANITRTLTTPCPLASPESMVSIIISVAITSIVFMLALILIIGFILQHWNKRKNEQLKNQCNAQNVGTDIHLESPQHSVVTKTLDVPFQQLTSPPECPAPILEHALDQHHELDKIIPAMYDLPENFSSKETSKMNEENQPHKDEGPVYFVLEENQDDVKYTTSPIKNSENVENPISFNIHTGSPNAQHSSSVQLKPNKAYEFNQVDQQPL